MKTETTTPLALSEPSSPIDHRRYMLLAIPLILSTLSTPILGAVDTAVVGHLPDPVYIGGVAVGSLIFNTLYWLLGFLRVSTSGFTAQAHGAKDQNEIVMTLLRPMGVALLCGLVFIVLQVPTKQIALSVIQPGPDVHQYSAQYFDIRIWGAPFALLNYAILGWLIGAARVRTALFVQVFMNVLNIVLDVLFVVVFHWGVAGVACASLISETTAAVIGLVIILKIAQLKGSGVNWKSALSRAPLVKMLSVNKDLLIRTACLLTVFTLFTSQGANMGEKELAANAILFQLHFIIAYFLSGFANANSILVGRAIGNHNKTLYEQTIKLSTFWGFVTACLLGLILVAGGTGIISLFTSIAEVQQMTGQYLLWVAVYPVVSFWALQLEGIHTGATEAAPVRNSLIISMLVFLVSIWLFIPQWHNHGLWFAFTLFSLIRSLSLWVYLPRLKSSHFR